VSSCHEAKYHKAALHVRGSVQTYNSFARIGASTAKVGNFKTCVQRNINLEQGWVISSPRGQMWPVTLFSVACGSIQKRSSNLKF